MGVFKSLRIDKRIRSLSDEQARTIVELLAAAGASYSMLGVRVSSPQEEIRLALGTAESGGHDAEQLLDHLIAQSNRESSVAAKAGPDTPPPKLRGPDEFKDLAVSEVPNERREAAEDPDTPTDVIRELAKDPSWYVRLGVTYNPNTPDELIKALTQDSSDTVSAAAYKAMRNRANRPEFVASPNDAVQIVQAEEMSDRMDRLFQLNQWLDAGRIDQREYDSLKAELFGRQATDASDGSD